MTVPIDIWQAWQRTPAADHWGRVVAIFLAEWNGITIGWPEGEGNERFEIFRVADSTIVTEAELPSREAQALDWRTA